MIYRTTTDVIGNEVQYYWADNKEDAMRQLRRDVLDLQNMDPVFEGLIDEVDDTWLEEVD